MIKIYICPECGWMRTVSRRKIVECYQCDCKEMVQTKLTYDRYARMTDQERKDYIESWMYIHHKSVDVNNIKR